MRARGTFKKVSGMEPTRRRALSGRRAVSAPRRRSREEDTCAREDDATGVPELRASRDRAPATGKRARCCEPSRGGRCGTRGWTACALPSAVCAGVRRTRAELRAVQIPRRGRTKRVCFSSNAGCLTTADRKNVDVDQAVTGDAPRATRR